MKIQLYPLILAVAGLAILSTLHCSADTLVVQNTDDDEPDSLRDAINNAQDGDTITFAPGLTGPIILNDDELLITNSITIQGPGASNLSVDGNASWRVFEISNSATVTISGLCITNGLAPIVPDAGGGHADGGGIYIDEGGTLTLKNCWVVNNAAVALEGPDPGAFGGGIYFAVCGEVVTSSLTLIDTTVSGNIASSGGDAWGGGIYFVATCNNSVGLSSLALSNCTITGNTASSNPENQASVGGGLAFQGPTTYAYLNHCTISGNIAEFGGGISLGGGGGSGLSVANTIVAANTLSSVPPNLPMGVGPDCWGGITSQGFNLVGNADGSSGWMTSGVGADQIGTTGHEINPLLGPLQFNGGPTLTMPPKPGSPAVNNGTVNGLPTDQRGQPRPSFWSGAQLPLEGDGSDIGAVEVQYPVLLAATGPHLGTGTIPPLRLTWIPPEAGWEWFVQQSPSMLAGSWADSQLPIINSGGTNVVTIQNPIGNGFSGIAFFRLALTNSP